MNDSDELILYDRMLILLALTTVILGFIMITSASVSIGQKLANDPFLFAKRDALYIIIAIFTDIIILSIPILFWKQNSLIMLIISILTLLLVLIIGNSINGAVRWIILGPIRIQPAEFTKLSFFCYLSNYLVKYNYKYKTINNHLKLTGIILILSVLLLAQSDLGTVIIIFITTLSILFLVGAKFWQFIIISLSILFIATLVFYKPYRIRRITSFLNPWEDPFGSGYQLTQSLMAFGRGEFWGQGLGNSIQKLEYLPEAHTDFIFSVISEELGYIGAVSVLIMIFFISLRAMFIGKEALKINNYFSGYLACSIGIWFSFQTLINVGATTGILPTKGLTLPLISYGGSSLLIMSTAVMMLLRIDYEIRLEKLYNYIRV